MLHVRNAWHVACWSMDLAAKAPFAITVAGDPIVIFRSESGMLAALEDRCVHRLAPLSLGRCEGETLRCMYHGLRFAADGACVEIPGQETIPATARVRAYPVVERHSWIWVWPGDPAKADPALIPPAVGFDDPDYILGRGQLDYQANAQLIHDNLCELRRGCGMGEHPPEGDAIAARHQVRALGPRAIGRAIARRAGGCLVEL